MQSEKLYPEAALPGNVRQYLKNPTRLLLNSSLSSVVVDTMTLEIEGSSFRRVLIARDYQIKRVL
jgi:hypothetical protein